MFNKLLGKVSDALVESTFRRAVRNTMSEFPWFTEDAAEKFVITGGVLINGNELISLPERIQRKHRDYIEDYRRRAVTNPVTPEEILLSQGSRIQRRLAR